MAARPCGDALRVALLETDAGAGQRNATFTLTNDGPVPCTVAGRPAVDARTAGAATSGARMSGMKVTYDPDPTVTLVSGAQAMFGVTYVGIPATDRPCVDADSIRIIAPHATRATTLALAMHLCAERVLRVTPVRAHE